MYRTLSRRWVLSSGLVVTALVALGRRARAQKAPKSAVQYQDSPKGDQRCSGCIHFQAEQGACALVEGEILPDGWCALFSPKA